MMRPLLLLTLVLASCSSPAPPSQSIRPTATKVEYPANAGVIKEIQKPAPSSPVPKGPISAPTFVRTNLGGIPIDAVTFDSRSHYLAVADQPDGPGSKWPDCRAAGQANRGIAAINAGFFTPEGAPLGKVIANGTSAGGVNRASSLGAGFYIRSSSGDMDLIRREQFSSGRQALQSGPFLVERGRPVGGLSEKQSSARCFIAHDGGTRWIIARTDACSLKSLASALGGKSIGSIKLEFVLNLDGGRSSEIWVSAAISSPPYFERPFWNKAVRNYLILRAVDQN